ncbi:MAG: hypothetical protein HDR20_03325 [Lachnospiraceae bacterium]|nr:hypothetical protein [Lachnospiraceae bacterium]
MKKKIILGVLLMLMHMLTGCEQKVITVADIQSEDGQETEYIEMKEFELKSAKAEDAEDSVQYCALLIPVGYKPSEEIEGMYVHERSPLDSSNIYYTVSQGNEDGKISEKLTREVYEETIEKAFSEEGWEIDLQIESFEEIDMEGVPGYKIRSTYAVEDGQIEQLTYLIMAHDTYTITYSQMADDQLMTDFDISGDEIRLIRNEESSLAKLK